MDRICLSVAIMPMAKEFGWPASMQGVVQSAFLWGYMATQLLGGALADKYGGKVVMAGGIVWFSLASMLMPVALSEPIVAAGLTVPAVLAARCAVGLGEGVALPSMNNLIASHIPKEAKSKALGMAFSGFHCGNLLGLIVSPLLLITFGWRALFCIFGLLGAPLLLMWLAVVPQQPSTQQRAADASSSQATSSSSNGANSATVSSSGRELSAVDLMAKSATWAIIIVNIVNHWGYFIYLNWMPTYFNQALGFDLRASSFLAFLPWLVMAVGSSASGVLADSLIARGVNVTSVRKVLQSIALMVPAAALMVLAQPNISAKYAVGAMTVALGTTSLGQAGFVANMSDIAPRHAGKMFGLCNTFGSFSGIVGVAAVGFIVEATQSFSTVFQITAVMYVVATIVWNMLCTGERVFT